MQYKIKLIQHIHSSFSGASSNDVWLEKEIWLPFPPFIGLAITNDKYFSAVISEVYWCDDKKEIECYTPPDKEIYNAQLNYNKHRPLEDIVEAYLEMGWEIEEKYKQRLKLKKLK